MAHQGMSVEAPFPRGWRRMTIAEILGEKNKIQQKRIVRSRSRHRRM